MKAAEPTVTRTRMGNRARAELRRAGPTIESRTMPAHAAEGIGTFLPTTIATEVSP
jgi:hypothetical protein